MKKLFFLLALVLFAASGCKEKKPVVYTVLGMYTPYQNYMEKMTGKVESVTEINYWAVPEGESFIKGAKMTAKELDSLGFTGNFKATFDEAGDLVSCAFMDENEKVLARWEITKENNLLTRAEYFFNDTLKFYNELKTDLNGKLSEVMIYRAVPDTLIWRLKIERTAKSDTITYKYFNLSDELTGKDLQIFDASGRVIRDESYNKEGMYTGGIDLNYGESMMADHAIFYNKEKQIAGENLFTYTFDSQGNWVTVVCKVPGSFAIIGERVYTYFE